MEQIVTVTILEKYDNLTVKEFLKECHVGRPTIEKIRVNKCCFINGENKDIENKIHEKDVLSFKVEVDNKIPPYQEKLDIAYEDKDFLIVNKPVGMLVHSDGDNNGHTLNNLVAFYYECTNQNVLIKPVHRLDLETSGLVIYVKNFLIGSLMDHLMEQHIVERKYLALVKGVFDKNHLKGKVYYRIGKDRHNSKKYRVSSTGVDAVTFYEVVEQLDNYSLVSLKLQTGRTHQIRVHMTELGHPLLGDVLYGEKKNLIKRVALHSSSVEFVNPLNEKKIKVISSLPEDMKKLCK